MMTNLARRLWVVFGVVAVLAGLGVILVSQSAHTALAETIVGGGDGETTPLDADPPPGETARDVDRQDDPYTLNYCAMRSEGVVLKEPLPDDFVPDYNQKYLGMEDLRTQETAPLGEPLMECFTPEGVPILGCNPSRKPGETLISMTIIENVAVAGDPDPCVGVTSALLFDFQSGFRVEGTDIYSDIPLNFQSTDDELTDNEKAWGVMVYDIPISVDAQLKTYNWTRSEADIFDVPGSSNDVGTWDDDYVDIEGPGFEIESFVLQPGAPAPPYIPGTQVPYRITVDNKRPDLDIQGIELTAADPDFQAELDACSDNPFSGAWKNPEGTAITVLGSDTVPGDPAENRAYCDVNITIPESFTGDLFSIEIDVTAAGVINPGLLVTKTGVVSEEVGVAEASMVVSKSVQEIFRPGAGPDAGILYPNDDNELPSVAPGDRITYHISVENDGDFDLTNLRVQDQLLGLIVVDPVDPEGYVLASDATWERTPEPYYVSVESPDPLVNIVTVNADTVDTDTQGDPLRSLDESASTSVDVVDSNLQVTLQALDGGGSSIDEVTPPATIYYQLTVRNVGSVPITDISYLDLGSQLPLVGFAPGTFPEPPISDLAPGSYETREWTYDVSSGDDDPLISTVRLRGIADESLIYGQDQSVVDLTVEGLTFDVTIEEPTTGVVLSGADVVYRIDLVNTGDFDLCKVRVDQILRDPDSGQESVVMLGVPMDWPGTAGQLGTTTPNNAAAGVVTYQVTGQEGDPLNMIFEVNATTDCPDGALNVTDRTSAVLDVSDVRVSTELRPLLGTDDFVVIGGDPPYPEVIFDFVATNLSGVTLEELSAEWEALSPGAPPPETFTLNPGFIGGFQTTTGSFTYQFRDEDLTAEPFIMQVTLSGKDNKGNIVSIKSSAVVSVVSADIGLELTGPSSAVEGDTITVNYTITNKSTEYYLSNVKLENLLLSGDQTVATLVEPIPPLDSRPGSFTYPVEPGVGINEEGVLLLTARATGTTDIGPAIATDSIEVDILPILALVKGGPDFVVAGEDATYTILIANQSTEQTVTIDPSAYSDNALSQDPYGITDFSPYFDDPANWESGVVGTLGPGESVRSEDIQVTVEEEPNPLVNTFSVTGTSQESGRDAYAEDTHELEVGCPIGFDFTVVNQEEPPTDVDNILGETLRWQVTLINQSEGEIDIGSVNEDLYYEGANVDLSSFDWVNGGLPEGTLGPGDYAEMLFPDPDNPGELVNYFDKLITNEYVDIVGGGDQMFDTVRVGFAGSPATDECMGYEEYDVYSPIVILKTADKGVAFTGDTVTYTFTLVNLAEDDDAPYDIFKVETFDSLLGELVEFDLDGAPATTFNMYPAPAGSGEFGDLVMGTATYTIQDTDPERLSNTATTSFWTLDDPDYEYMISDSAEVITGKPLAINKVPSVSEIGPGETLTYDYSITNVSSFDVEILSMIDVFDDTDETTREIIPPNPDPPIELAPGDSYIDLATMVGVPYQVPLDASGLVSNTVTVTGEIEGYLFEQEVTVGVPLTGSELTIVKYMSETGDPTDPYPGTKDEGALPEVDNGTDMYFCFELTNVGGPETYVDVTSLVDNRYNDTENANLYTRFQEAVSAQLDSVRDPEKQGNLTYIYGGEILDFCMDSPKTLSLSEGIDPYTNTITLTGMSSAGTPVLAEDEVAVDLIGDNYRVTKSAVPVLGFVGDTIRYTIRVENTSGQPIQVDEVYDSRAPSENLLLEFDWPRQDEGAEYIGFLPRNGGYVEYTYDYIIQETDPDPLLNGVTSSGELLIEVGPDEYVRSGDEVFDGSQAAVAVTSSRLLVHKQPQQTVVSPSPNNCEVKDGVGDDPDRPACIMIRYVVTVTHVANKPETVFDLVATDSYLDPETGEPAQTQYILDDEPAGDGLEPYEVYTLIYEQPVPTAAQLATTPELDPYLNTITVQGQARNEQGEDVGDPDVATSDASVEILQPNVRITKTPVYGAAAAGQNVPYDIEIRNTGGAAETLFSVTLQDRYYDPDLGMEVDLLDPALMQLDTLCTFEDDGSGFNGNPNCPFEYGNVPYEDRDGNPDTLEPNPYGGTKYDPNRGVEASEVLLGRITAPIPSGWTGNEFTNVAQVDATIEGGGVATDRASATVDIRTSGINVVKEALTDTAAVGTAVRYSIRVENVGTSNITELTISDEGMDGDTSVTFPNAENPEPFDDPTRPNDDPDNPDEPTILEPGDEFVYEYEHTLTQLDSLYDFYVNEVTVFATTPTGTVVNVASDSVEVLGAAVDVEKYVCAGEHITPPGPETFSSDPRPGECLDYVNLSVGGPHVLTYYLHISNIGGVPLYSFQVDDNRAGSLTGIVWPYSDAVGDGLDVSDGLAGGNDEVWVAYTYTLPIGAPDIFNNTATVTGQSEELIQTQDSATASLRIANSNLLLTKTVDPAQARVGQTVEYSFTVENLGTTDISNDVRISDPLLDGVIATVTGGLGAGETSSVYTGTHTISPAQDSPLVNVATAEELLPGGGIGLTDTSSASVEIVSSGLSVSKVADPENAQIGDLVTFTYRIENTGSSPIDNLVVLDSDPDAVFSPPWPEDSLLPGEEWSSTWTREMTVFDDDPYQNTVTVVGEDSLGDPVRGEATETVSISSSTSALTVTNTPLVSYAEEGAPVTFVYVVTNTGDTELTGLNVSDNLCGDLITGGALASGTNVTADCTVSAYLPSVISTVYAEAGGDNIDTATAEVAVIPLDAELLITKDASPPVVSAGDTINYRIEATNVGDSSLPQVVIEDTRGPSDPEAMDPLAAGESRLLTFTEDVPAVDPPESYSNTAAVIAYDTAVPPNELASASDSAMVSVVINDPDDLLTEDLILTKEASPSQVQPGETVTYTFTIRNISTNTVGGIRLIDPMFTDPTTTVLTPGLTKGTNYILLPDPLGPGNVATVRVAVDMPSGWAEPQFSNTAQLQSTVPSFALQDLATATVDVELLTLDKLPSPTSAVPGQTVTYTFDIGNLSSNPNGVEGVTLEDVPVLAWDPAPLINGTVPPGGFDPPITGTTTIPFPIGFSANPDDPVVPPYNYPNTAAIYVDGVRQEIMTVYVTVDETLLTLTKQPNPATAPAGTEITYTFTLVNGTSAPIMDVTLIDPIIETWVDHDGDGVAELVNGTLDPGMNTFTGTATIPADYAELIFSNTATLQVGGVDYTMASADVFLGDLPTLEKSAPSAMVLGRTFEYEFTINNPNDFDLPNVTLSDTLIDTADGAWVDNPVIGDLPPGETVITATYTVPVDYPDPTIENTADLLLGTAVVATAGPVTTDVVDSTFVVTIDEFYQNSDDDHKLDALAGDLLRTGQQTYVTYTVTNFDPAHEVSDISYTLGDTDPALENPPDCQPVDGGPPASLAVYDTGDPDEGYTATVTCVFTPPSGQDYYLEPGGLLRTFAVTAEGTSNEEAVDYNDQADFELVDLVLGVDLEIPVGGVVDNGLSANITFNFTLSNEGASAIGCGASIPDDEPCHVSVTVDDDGNPTTPNALNTEVQALGDLISDLVLTPKGSGDGESETFSGLEIVITQPPDAHVMVAEGGYYDADLYFPDDLLDYYDEVRATDTQAFGGLEITSIITSPSPPVFGESVIYQITLTNNSPFTVTGPVATGGGTPGYLQGTWQISPVLVQAAQEGIVLASHGASPMAQTETALSGTLTFAANSLAPGQSTTATYQKAEEDQETSYLFIVTASGYTFAPPGGAADTHAGDQASFTPDGLAAPGTDPNATAPIVAKTPSVTEAQPGDSVTWTITVRNGWTRPMPNLVISDEVPGDLTINAVTTSAGSGSAEGQIITVNAGTLASGASVTVTIDTTISAEAASPSTVLNSACATYEDGTQVCESGRVSLGPDVENLPATGIREVAHRGGDSVPALLGLVLAGALMLLMGASTTSNSRMMIAMVFVVIVIAVVVVAVVVLALGGDEDDDTAQPTDQAEAPPTAVSEPTLEPTEEPEPTAEVVTGPPPTVTPYVVPTPAGVRYLTIPKLGDQFQVPVPIVDIPITNRQWDVSGLGYYVGWLEGTTWMDPQWGNTVLAAHVQLGTNNPGPFWGLDELAPGDEILVTEGEFEHRFRVVEISSVDPDDWTVTAPTEGPTLTLITCTSWDQSYGIFAERMVVRAIPLTPDTGPAG